MKTSYEILKALDALILHLNAEGFDTTKLSQAATLIIVFHNEVEKK